MALDEVERAVGFEFWLDDVGRAQHLVQRDEERHAAVVTRAAPQVHVGTVEAEDRDDLEDVFDVDAVRPPRTFGMAGRPGGVDHRRAEPARTIRLERAFRGFSH